MKQHPSFSVPRRAVLRAAAALTLAPALAACQRRSDQHWDLTNVHGIMPDLKFSLTDDQGRPVTAQNYRGKIVLLYFGYTHCPDVCPTTLQLVSNAVAALGPDADKVRILFVSVDPKRDTQEILKAYTAAFSPQAVGLTGTMRQIEDITRRYRVAFSYGKPDAHGNYVVDHSAGVYVFGPDGHIWLLGSDTNPPAAWVHDLKQLVADTAV